MLNVLLAAPFIAAVLMALQSGRDGQAALRSGIALSLVQLVIGVLVFCSGPAYVNLPWFTLPGTGTTVHYALVADGIGSALAVLTLVLGPVALLGSAAAVGERMRDFATATFALQGCLLGAFLADDLVLFYFFFEAMLLPMVVLIGLFGEADTRRQASLQFFIYTMLGSIMMLVAIWMIAASTMGSTSFRELPAVVAGMSEGSRLFCFWAFALAFAVKTPLMPFHSWQAPVYAACPAGGAVLLAGAMAKLGTFGFMRYVLVLFPGESASYAGVFITLGIVGVIFGALLALAQQDLKRMLAFSSLSHLGLVVVGIFSFQDAALSGAVVQMVAHGLAVGTLFLLIGHLEYRSGMRYLDDFGGLAQRAPVYAVLFVGAALAAVALPGTAGFVGEVMLLQGTYAAVVGWLGLGWGIAVTALAGLSLILGAGYVLRAVQRVIYGPRDERGPIPDCDPMTGTAIGVLLAATFVIGIYPRLITVASEQTVQTIGDAVAAVTAPENAPVIATLGESDNAQ